MNKSKNNHKMTMKPFGRGNLNGEILSEITGTIEQRNARKEKLHIILNDPKSTDKSKEKAEEELSLIFKLELDTNEKQATTSFLKMAKSLTWVLTLFLISSFIYLIIHNASGELNFDAHATQAIIGLVSVLSLFWMSIVVAIFKKGANLNIKKPSDKII